MKSLRTQAKGVAHRLLLNPNVRKLTQKLLLNPNVQKAHAHAEASIAGAWHG